MKIGLVVLIVTGFLSSIGSYTYVRVLRTNIDNNYRYELDTTARKFLREFLRLDSLDEEAFQQIWGETTEMKATLGIRAWRIGIVSAEKVFRPQEESPGSPLDVEKSFDTMPRRTLTTAGLDSIDLLDMQSFDEVANERVSDVAIDEIEKWLVTSEFSILRIEPVSETVKRIQKDIRAEGTFREHPHTGSSISHLWMMTSSFPNGRRIQSASGKDLLVLSLLVIDEQFLPQIRWRATVRALAVLMLFAVCLIVTMHLGLTFLITKPLESLARQLRNSTPDSLNKLRVTISREDEIGDLQMAVNRFAGEISSRQAELDSVNSQLSRMNAELEQRVHDRTREVVEANRQLEVVNSQLGLINTDLERSNRDLDAFAYTVAHDLKTPLRNISYIIGTEVPEAVEKQDLLQARGLLDEAVRICNSNNDMIQALLEWSRTGRNPAKDVVDLEQVVSDLAETSRVSWEQDGVTLLRRTPLPTVIGDRALMQHVLSNLISNGAKYNEREQKIIEIGVQHHAGRGDCLYVRDNGIGIRPQYLERVFDLLKQVHTDRKKFTGGHGVGLAIVRRAVESYNGQVWVESEYGVGSTFWVTLPPQLPHAETK